MASGDSTNTSTSSTGSSNPQVTSTLNSLLGPNGGVQGVLSGGPHVFGQSMYGGVGPTTQGAWAGSLAAADNPTYAGGVQGALTDQAAKASGQNIGLNDPTYQAMRGQLSSDVLGQVGSQFTNSGRFGGGSYINDATKDLTSALGGLDYQQVLNGQQQQQQAIQNLPGLFSAGQAPSATAGAVGAAQDANTQGTLSGNADLFNRQQNSQLGLLQQLIPLLTGGAAAGGQTTTNTQPSPSWWQTGLGLGAALL